MVLVSQSSGDPTASAEAAAVSPAGPGEAELLAGTVTFLLTDIEGSTRLWEVVPKAMEVALERHNRLLTAVIEDHGGAVLTSRGEGDSFFAVFPGAVSAVEAAGACQLRLAGEGWPGGAVLRVRMGLHTGEARVRSSGRVDHAPINRCARVKAAGHGGQVLVTKTTRDLVDGRLGGEFGLKRLGEFRLRDLSQPELIYQLTHAGLPAEYPPIRTVAERPGNLPVPVSSFIGRERELEQTVAALGRARVVTLTGAGGVGKTRLGLQAAAQAAPRFADGAWLAELAPVRDVAGVDDAVAAVFSLTAQAGQDTREALAEFLHGKQLTEL
jgi:class 3 adenylate cyclase